MQALAAQLSQTIYSKTQKGLDEMTQRRFGLGMKQRRILIMMDGTKSLATIQEMVGDEGLGTIISFLLDQGFIAPAAKSAIKPAEPVIAIARPASEKPVVPPVLPATSPQVPVAPAPKRTPDTGAAAPQLIQDAVKIREVKDFMTTTATTYLGLLSAKIIHHIEKADDASQLMMVLGPWHMALRESKQGNRFAGPYLEQVKAVLSGKVEQHETM